MELNRGSQVPWAIRGYCPGFRGEASSEKGSPKGGSPPMGAGMATGRWQDHRENVWYQRVFMGAQDGRLGG